jgi:hypothetical protein
VSANVEIFGFVTDIDHVEVLRTFGETCSTEFSSLSHTTAVSRTELAYIVAEYSWLDKFWGREINSFFCCRVRDLRKLGLGTPSL